jgi:hypothetical protein
VPLNKARLEPLANTVLHAVTLSSERQWIFLQCSAIQWIFEYLFSKRSVLGCAMRAYCVLESDNAIVTVFCLYFRFIGVIDDSSSVSL